MVEGRVAADPGEVVALFGENGVPIQVVSPTAVEGAIRAEWIQAALRGTPTFGTGKASDGHSIRFYVVQLAVEPPAQRSSGVLLVGRPMDNIRAALGALMQTLLVVVPLMLVLSAGGGVFLARRALKPIDRMTQTTRRIEETDLGGRIEVRSSDEVGRLAQTINAMLDRLEAAFQRQRQFTGDASHELRTPLAVIEAETTLALRRERTPDEYRAALSTIGEEAVHMNRLVDQLLALARSDEGGSRPSFEPVDLGQLAAGVAVAMTPLAEERGISLSCEARDTCVVRGDHSQLRRLVANLIDNAIRYTEPAGRVTVSVAPADGSAVLTVRDTGIGIPPENLPHIFERFYRVRADRSRSEGGSGLGLALCKAIVEAHGGAIAVESQVGAGTAFTVTFARE